jgi:hypothetical protein
MGLARDPRRRGVGLGSPGFFSSVFFFFFFFSFRFGAGVINFIICIFVKWMKCQMVIGCCKMGGLQKVLTIGALKNGAFKLDFEKPNGDADLGSL